MASHFGHTLRSLEQQRRSSWRLLPALLLLAAWAVWLRQARVGVYASAARARVEVLGMTHRAAADVGGRIATLNCELGRSVESGQVLAELDASAERAALAIEHAVLDGLASKTAAIRRQIDAEYAKRSSRSRRDELATDQASLGLERARIGATQQAALTQIARELQREELNSRVDLVNANSELSQRELLVSQAATEVERLKASRGYEDKADLARITGLERELGDLAAERQVRLASVEAKIKQLDQRKIRAPSSGRLGSIAALQVGDVVKPGDVIASIVPEDDMRVVAEFPPPLAVGRILPGQSARVRLDGFSWIEYGALQASVRDVASEARAGTIRVELWISSTRLSGVPIQHGLPGSVDVLIGTASPWELLQRSVGSWLAAPPPADTLPEQATEPLARGALP